MFTTQAQVIDYTVGTIPHIQRPSYNARMVVTIIPRDDFGILYQAQDDEVTDELMSMSHASLQKDKSHFTSL